MEGFDFKIDIWGFQQGWVRVRDHEYEYEYFAAWKLDGEYEYCENSDGEYEYKYGGKF